MTTLGIDRAVVPRFGDNYRVGAAIEGSLIEIKF